MLRIGLTGGIGSGKSTVARIFEILGIPVYYADTATRRLMTEDDEVKRLVQQHFGDESYKNGILNRPYIANIVFADQEKLELLNSLTHPATIRDADRWMEKQEASYIIKEAALIFESGSAGQLDYIIGVYSPLELRLKRTINRDQVTREEVLQRMSRQIDENMKMKLCDFVLINDEKKLLVPQVLGLHEIFIAQEVRKSESPEVRK